MSLFLFAVMSLFIVFLLFQNNQQKIIVVSTPSSTATNIPLATLPDPLSNPYVPPERNEYLQKPIATRPFSSSYSQMGILTRKTATASSSDILPLMGRKRNGSRDKWQYYTVNTNSGPIQTKLPISVNGKSGMGEYGCDEIYNNDTVYVEGYKDIFVATIYENNMFSYSA